jgi:hypothetical protein
MKNDRFLKFLRLALSVAAVGILFMPAAADEVPMIGPDQLTSMLGQPDVVIVDVRLGESWNNSDRKIKGAVREDPMEVESWANKYPKDLTLVLY